MQQWSWMLAGCLWAAAATAQNNIPAPAPVAAGTVQAQPVVLTPEARVAELCSGLTAEQCAYFVPPQPATATLPAGDLPQGQPQPGAIYAAGPGMSANPAQAPDQPPIPADQLPPLPGMPPEVQAIRDFDTALQNQLGLKPDQIRRLRRMLDEQERAAAEPPGPPPKSVTGSLTVSLEPGATPPTVRTAMGAVSSFVVVDATGMPWPVENFRVGNAATEGNPQGFTVARLDGPLGSAFTIDAGQRYTQSNLVLKLAGNPTPVVVGLVAGQSEHDARVELRIQGRGPQARIVHSTLPEATDTNLLPVLDGIAPANAKPLELEGAEGMQGWMTAQGTMLIRTPHKIVSPASNAFVSSATGYHVYELSAVPSLLVMSGGLMVPVAVKGW